MPATDTTYAIGVIREWEKGLLEDDEYTRLIDAPSGPEAIRSLVETPYGLWLNDKSSLVEAFSALEKHLGQIHQWIKGTLPNDRFLKFISSRYDALNIATALIRQHNKADDPGVLSELGLISPDALHSTIWHDLGWEQIPTPWQQTIKKCLDKKLTLTEMIKKVALTFSHQREQLSFTPLMKQISALEKTKRIFEEQTRPLTPTDNISEQEKDWDRQLLKLIKEYRFNPTGYDSVLAFWSGKEIEVKNLRLLLSAKIMGLPSRDIRELRLPLYRSFV